MKNYLGAISFLLLLILAMIIVVGYRFEKYYIQKDYTVTVFTNCNIANHSCFIADPSTADPAFQNAPYAKVQLNAHFIPQCLEEHTCTNFSCSGTPSCTISYCSAKNVSDGESCSVTPTTATASST
jgi:hypothetical protein